MPRMSPRSDAEIAERMANAISNLLTALALGKFRPPTGMAYIIEADFLETPEVGELSASADEWTRTT